MPSTVLDTILPSPYAKFSSREADALLSDVYNNMDNLSIQYKWSNGGTRSPSRDFIALYALRSVLCGLMTFSEAVLTFKLKPIHFQQELETFKQLYKNALHAKLSSARFNVIAAMEKVVHSVFIQRRVSDQVFDTLEEVNTMVFDLLPKDKYDAFHEIIDLYSIRTPCVYSWETINKISGFRTSLIDTIDCVVFRALLCKDDLGEDLLIVLGDVCAKLKSCY
jgi:hypothetical protein